MNLVQIGTNEFFPNSPLLNSREPSTTTRGRRCSPLSNSPFTQRYFPTGIRDGGRREPREPRFCSLGRKYVCRDLAAVGTLQQVQESPVRGSNGGALATASSLRFGRPIGAHRTRKNVDTQLHRQRLDELRVNKDAIRSGHIDKCPRRDRWTLPNRRRLRQSSRRKGDGDRSKRSAESSKRP